MKKVSPLITVLICSLLFVNKSYAAIATCPPIESIAVSQLGDKCIYTSFSPPGDWINNTEKGPCGKVTSFHYGTTYNYPQWKSSQVMCSYYTDGPPSLIGLHSTHFPVYKRHDITSCGQGSSDWGDIKIEFDYAACSGNLAKTSLR